MKCNVVDALPVAATAPADPDNATAKMPVIPEFKVIKSTKFIDHDGKSGSLF